jgi:hypothetical protein
MRAPPRRPLVVTAIFLFAWCALGSSALAWTPVPAGPNTIGTFRWDKAPGTPPDRPDEYIVIEWIPPAGGAPCATTAMVQTYRQWFVHQDGSIENLDKPSDVFDGMDWTQFGPDGRRYNEDKQRQKRESDDPNTTPAGHTVDAAWCDQDPYYNGDDAADRGRKGTNGGKAMIADQPSRDDIYFTGTRVKAVYEFEICVYCFNADGTLGQPLASMKWRWEKTKGAPGGIVSVPAGPSSQPSQEHKDAADLFVNRHTRTENGIIIKFCPELAEQIWQQAWELSEALKRMDDETEAARQAVRDRIKALLDRVRQMRGR